MRARMRQAALQAGCDPDRLSFVHAVQVVRAAILDFHVLTPAQWPRLKQRLLAELACGRLARRRPRSHPRVVRPQSATYPQKRPGQRGWARWAGSYADGITVPPPPPVAPPAVRQRLPAPLRRI